MASALGHAARALLVLAILVPGGIAGRDGSAGMAAKDAAAEVKGTIAFSTVGRAHYAFDVYALSLEIGLNATADAAKERVLTDGASVNSNGHLVEGVNKADALQWIATHGGASPDELKNLEAAASGVTDVDALVYVTEIEGKLAIAASFFVGGLEAALRKCPEKSKKGSVFHAKSLLGETSSEPYMQDRPQVGGGRLVFTSTQQVFPELRQSWAAVYSAGFLSAEGEGAVRLTPDGATDFSPALSPSGKWVIAASLQGKGWDGSVKDLPTDLYVFSAADGARRSLVVRNGGWPSWADESTVYFHRVADDGWWSVFKVSLSESFLATGDGAAAAVGSETRVTPPGLHAFTPSASRTGAWIAVATRRPGSSFRHVEAFDLSSRQFVKLTETIAPDHHHLNPFVSPSSDKVVYHRCRGATSGGCGYRVPRLETLESPIPGLALVRTSGYFPVFSPDGSRLAFTDNEMVDLVVTTLDGSLTKTISGGGQINFGLAWDHARPGVLFTARGPSFASEDATVHIVAISGLDSGDETEITLGESNHKVLTRDGTGNNAFPAPSPDGKHVVFRSGRSGHKNLYVMDAVDGEAGGLRRLTDGPWTDTMPHWSPDGEWIAFSSTRDSPSGLHFAGYLVRPDGSDLHKVLGGNGRVNHLHFSPDSQSLVFTSDFAAVSGEPISTPNQFQPYGEIYIANLDGSDPRRLTHNDYEDGTPSWGPAFVPSSDHASQVAPQHSDPGKCEFVDMNWLAHAGQQSVPELIMDSVPPFGGCPFQSLFRNKL